MHRFFWIMVCFLTLGAGGWRALGRLFVLWLGGRGPTGRGDAKEGAETLAEWLHECSWTCPKRRCPHKTTKPHKSASPFHH